MQEVELLGFAHASVITAVVTESFVGAILFCPICISQPRTHPTHFEHPIAGKTNIEKLSKFHKQ